MKDVMIEKIKNGQIYCLGPSERDKRPLNDRVVEILRAVKKRGNSFNVELHPDHGKAVVTERFQNKETIRP